MKASTAIKLYLKEYGWHILLFALCMGVFQVVLFLYQIEPEAVLYAGILSLGMFLLFEAVHGYYTYRKHQNLRQVLWNVPLMTEELPQPSTVLEQDFKEIIEALGAHLNRSMTEWEQKEQSAMDFYSTWVHQIKTPIAVMKMLLQREDTKENRALLSELFRIEQYVEMVLSYLRLGSESSDFVIQTYDIDRIVKSAIHKFAPQFIEKKIALSYESTHLNVVTDEKWLSFIVEQIFSNSIKYTKTGTVTIEVTPDAVLKISDTGIGIAPEDLPRIFEKGFTGFNGRGDKKATGLGLYLCKETADRLSHRISVESTVNQGTTVSIDLNRPKLGVE